MVKAVVGLLALLAIWVWVLWDLPPRLKEAEEGIVRLRARIEFLEDHGA
jgi:hypothetical protein